MVLPSSHSAPDPLMLAGAFPGTGGCSSQYARYRFGRRQHSLHYAAAANGLHKVYSLGGPVCPGVPTRYIPRVTGVAVSASGEVCASKSEVAPLLGFKCWRLTVFVPRCATTLRIACHWRGDIGFGRRLCIKERGCICAKSVGD